MTDRQRLYNRLSFLFGLPGLVIGISSFSNARAVGDTSPHGPLYLDIWGPWGGGALFITGMIFYFLAKAGSGPMVIDRARAFDELKKALLALSLPGPDALATLPEGVVKADELALDYDNCLQVALGNFGTEFTPPQRKALERVNRLLDDMSGPKRADLWIDAAVLEHPKWSEVRECAREARRLLGWG